jgi:3-deoxy-7-phosphoheptulonate synthase
MDGDLPNNIMIDCSHGNTNKDYTMQPKVAQYCIDQVLKGNDSIIGLMLESNIHEGNQKITNDLKYGVSLIDACINWETTETLSLTIFSSSLRRDLISNKSILMDN